jgi:DNA-binding response OmpR family regulator
MPHLLLVDDDTELAELLQEYLSQEGFEVSMAHDGESGIRLLDATPYALAVLDVMMPGLSGIDVLRHLRRHSDMPVIMLTAKGDDVDRIVGLELGADDYVPKPCSPRELVARIRAVLRRFQAGKATASSQEALAVGDVLLAPAQRTAHWRGQPLNLTSTEFNILLVLVRQAGQVVSKAELSEQALGRSLARFDRSLDVHLSSIRQKLGEHPDGQPWIHTIRGVGYQWRGA